MHDVFDFFLRSTIFMKNVISNIDKDSLLILTSGVVFTTVISLIPLITVIAMFLSGLGIFEAFLSMSIANLSESLGPSLAQQIIKLTQTYTDNARELGLIGIISFSISSIFLINRVWAVINLIYKSVAEVRFIRRFINFLFTLIIGLIFIALFITLQTLANEWIAEFLGIKIIRGLVIYLLKYLATPLIVWLSMFLITKFVPASKAKTSSALLGSFISTILFLVFNNVFSNIIKMMVSYSVIYGSFASIFFFLFWIYAAWLIVFISVEISYVKEYKPYLNKNNQMRGSPNNKMTESINIYLYIAHRFYNGYEDVKTKDITQALSINIKQVNNVTKILVANRFIISTGKNSFIPSKPLEKVDIQEVVSVLYGLTSLSIYNNTVGSDISDTFREGGLKEIKGTNIEQLVNRMGN